LWVFAPFWNAKPTIYGLREPLVQWSLQGKKVPKRHFFEILRAKRNKLLGIVISNPANRSPPARLRSSVSIALAFSPSRSLLSTLNKPSVLFSAST
jgi:hypothetical protein